MQRRSIGPAMSVKGAISPLAPCSETEAERVMGSMLSGWTRWAGAWTVSAVVDSASCAEDIWRVARSPSAWSRNPSRPEIESGALTGSRGSHSSGAKSWIRSPSLAGSSAVIRVASSAISVRGAESEAWTERLVRSWPIQSRTRESCAESSAVAVRSSM